MEVATWEPGDPTIPMIPHIGYRFGLSKQDLGVFVRRSLLLPHRSISLAPSKFPKPGSYSVTTARALSLLLVIGVSSTSPTSDMCRLLPLTHTRSTLRHAKFTLGRRGHRPTCYEGYPKQGVNWFAKGNHEFLCLGLPHGQYYSRQIVSQGYQWKWK